MVYRVSDLIPLWTFIVMGLGILIPPHTLAGLLGGIALALAMINGRRDVLPRMQAENNTLLMQMGTIREQTPTNAWILSPGGDTDLYVPYFAQRRVLLLQRYGLNPGELDRLVRERLQAGESVFALEKMIEEPLWVDFLKQYKLTIFIAHGVAGEAPVKLLQLQ